MGWHSRDATPPDTRPQVASRTREGPADALHDRGCSPMWLPERDRPRSLCAQSPLSALLGGNECVKAKRQTGRRHPTLGRAIDHGVQTGHPKPERPDRREGWDRALDQQGAGGPANM